MWIPVFVLLAPLFRSMIPARLEEYCPPLPGSPLRERLISIFPNGTSDSSDQGSSEPRKGEEKS